MQFAAPALMLAGGLVQGIAGSKSAKYNARAAEANARSALMDGNVQAGRIRNAGRVELGKQFLAQAESGFEVGTGSAIDTLRESATNNELEAMDAMHEAQSRAYAYREEARLQKKQAKFSLISGVLGGAASAVGSYNDYAAARAG